MFNLTVTCDRTLPQTNKEILKPTFGSNVGPKFDAFCQNIDETCLTQLLATAVV